MKILKRLFCKHDYVQTTPDLTGTLTMNMVLLSLGARTVKKLRWHKQ